jgi:uncharacterized protein DUF6152
MTTIGQVFAILTISTVSLTAHHAYTVAFDVSKKVTLTGTLTKVDWRNPHIEISLDARGDRGQVEAWVIEGGPIGFFSRNKVSRSDFEKGLGQTVTLEVYRARDGKLLGSLLKITFADGKSLTSDPMA